MPDPRFRPVVAVFSGGGTGGHLYPALALAQALGKLRPDLAPFFVGARQGVEARILPERGLHHHLLPVRGFRRGRVWENILVLGALLRSMLLTGRLFSQLRPGIVVVTGGYAGGPAGLMAGIMGVPLALQEQNAYPGFTTRVLSRWARQVHLAFPEALDHLPRPARSRAQLSGNPVREAATLEPDRARAHFGIAAGDRTVLIVGGSQGAEALNRAALEGVRGVVAGDLERPENTTLLWATGPNHLQAIREELRKLGDPEWVRLHGFIQEMPEALSAATLAVSRAGAMATSEFLAWEVPVILVPLPTAAADHQRRNAESLAEAGTAVHLPQSRLSGSTLWREVLSLLGDSERLAAMGRAARAVGRPQATREIAEALESLLPRPELRPGRGGAPETLPAVEGAPKGGSQRTTPPPVFERVLEGGRP